MSQHVTCPHCTKSCEIMAGWNACDECKWRFLMVGGQPHWIPPVPQMALAAQSLRSKMAP